MQRIAAEDIVDEIKRNYYSKLDLFSLNKEKAKPPTFKAVESFPIGVCGRYFGTKHTIQLNRAEPIYLMDLNHEVSHCIHQDLARHTLFDAMDEGNEKAVAYIESEISEYYNFTRKQGALRRIFCAKQEEDRYSEHANIISTMMIGMLPGAWCERFASSVFPHKINIEKGGVSYRLYESFVGRIKKDQVIEDACLIGGAGLLGIVGYGLIGALLVGGVIGLEVAPTLYNAMKKGRWEGLLSSKQYMEKVAKAPPSIRKFCWLGPSKDESLDDFVSVLKENGLC